MAEFEIKIKAKKTIWFYLLLTTSFLWKLRFIKMFEGKPLANLYVGRKFYGAVKFKLSDFN